MARCVGFLLLAAWPGCWPVLGCSCLGTSFLEKWEEAEHAFIIRIQEVEVVQEGDGEASSGLTHAFFELERVYRGDPNRFPFIEADHKPICCACGATLTEGERFLAFAFGEGPLGFSVCSPFIGLTNDPESHDPFEDEVLPKLARSEPMEEIAFLAAGAVRQEQFGLSDARDLRSDRSNSLFADGLFLVRIRGYRLEDGRPYALELLEYRPFSGTVDRTKHEIYLK